MLATGYVHNLVDRKLSFEEWVWTCARAMGALIMMRDEGMNAPIPERFEASNYHGDRLKEARGQLDSLTSVDPKAFGEAAWKREQESYEYSLKSYFENKAKFDFAMDTLAQTKAWVPPTPEHEGFKKFMVDQLESSVGYGAGTLPDKPARKTDEEYIAEAREGAVRDIAYHLKYFEEEQVALESRNTWVKALKTSVPIPASMQPTTTGVVVA